MKKFLSFLLTLALLFTTLPLSSDLLSVKASYVDYSNLTINQYISKILLNHDYYGVALSDGDTIPHQQLSNWLDQDKGSLSKRVVENLENNSRFISSVAAWKAATFQPSDITNSFLDEKGYYTAILYSILDAEMNNSSLLENLNNDYSSVMLSMNKSILSILKEIVDADIAENDLKSLQLSSLTDDEFNTLVSKVASDKMNKEFLDYVSKPTSYLSDIIKVCNTIDDVTNMLSSYIMISQLGQEIENVLYALYTNCPSTNTAMQSALSDVYDISSSNFKAAILGLREIGLDIVNNGFSKTVDKVWSTCISSIGGSFANGLLIGQAIGKTISNFCFSTDKIIEQYYIMDAVLEFEKLMIKTVGIMGDTYKSTESVEAADNYIQSVKMLFSTYILDSEYSSEFFATFADSIWLSSEEKQEIAECQGTIDSFKKTLNFACGWLTGIKGYVDYHEEDAPNYGANVPSSDVEIYTEGFKYTLSNDGTYYSVTDIGTVTATNVIIPSTYNGLPVTKIGRSAFDGCTDLTSITIPDSVTSIDRRAFFGCTGLTSITIPNSVTSIGSLAFAGCTGLTSIPLPDSVTSIYSTEFYGCTGLTSITIPDSVTYIYGGAFSGCYRLTNIAVDEDNSVYHSAGNCLIETASKTLILGCKNSVIPTDGSVTSIDGAAFNGCTGLTSITIPDSVTSIGDSAFYNCDSLTIYCYKDSYAHNWAIDNSYSYSLICDHSYETIITAPTCTKGGYTTYTCTECGDTYTDSIIEAAGQHSYGGGVVTEPTCTEGGYTTYTCTECGDTYTDNFTEATGHNYEAVVTAPTCTEGGYTTHICTECGDTYKDDATEATGHLYDGDYDTACNVCGEIRELYDETVAVGDACNDSVINSKDIIIIKMYLAGMIDGINVYAADVNGDGAVTSDDVITLAMNISSQ